MKCFLFAATALAILPTLASAQRLREDNSAWMPPEEYDHPYTAGPVIVTRADEKLMPKLCRGHPPS